MIFPNAAFGWECGTKTHEEWSASSGAIFEGKVVYISGVASDDGSDPWRTVVTFEVTDVLKGDVGGLVKVGTGVFGDSPGYPFLCGENYVVYASKNEEGDYWTDACTPTRPLSEDAPSYDEIELAVLVNSPDIPEPRKQEIRDKWFQRCPEHPEFVFKGDAGKIFEFVSCERISGLTCRIKYNGELPYPKELRYSTYDSGGRIMKKDKSLKWWGPEKLEKGERGIFTFQDLGYQDPLRIEITGVWE